MKQLKKLEGIISGLTRHSNLNKSDMLFVARCLQHYKAMMEIAVSLEDEVREEIESTLNSETMAIRASDYIKLAREVEEEYTELTRAEQRAIFDSRLKIAQNGGSRPDLIKADLGKNASKRYK